MYSLLVEIAGEWFTLFQNRDRAIVGQAYAELSDEYGSVNMKMDYTALAS